MMAWYSRARSSLSNCTICSRVTLMFSSIPVFLPCLKCARTIRRRPEKSNLKLTLARGKAGAQKWKIRIVPGRERQRNGALKFDASHRGPAGGEVEPLIAAAPIDVVLGFPGCVRGRETRGAQRQPFTFRCA